MKFTNLAFLVSVLLVQSHAGAQPKELGDVLKQLNSFKGDLFKSFPEGEKVWKSLQGCESSPDLSGCLMEKVRKMTQGKLDEQSMFQLAKLSQTFNNAVNDVREACDDKDVMCKRTVFSKTMPEVLETTANIWNEVKDQYPEVETVPAFKKLENIIKDVEEIVENEQQKLNDDDEEFYNLDNDDSFFSKFQDLSIKGY